MHSVHEINPRRRRKNQRGERRCVCWHLGAGRRCGLGQHWAGGLACVRSLQSHRCFVKRALARRFAATSSTFAKMRSLLSHCARMPARLPSLPQPAPPARRFTFVNSPATFVNSVYICKRIQSYTSVYICAASPPPLFSVLFFRRLRRPACAPFGQPV